MLQITISDDALTQSQSQQELWYENTCAAM